MKKTIAALATPSGISGLAVIRLSGDESITIIDKIFVGKKKISDSKTHTIHYGKIVDAENMIDDVTISIFLSPNSYTGENVIEIGCHGGLFTVKNILDLLYRSGAIQADPGEFTRRAFMNGRLDLLQVEAVADIIHSQSSLSSEISARQNDGQFSERLNSFIDSLISIASRLELENDFADEDIEFTDKNKIISDINAILEFCNNLINDYSSSEILRSGYYVCIIGYPNAGKSSLFNSIINKQRAIVSDEKGTTRDYIEETLLINNLAIKLFDTAGIRKSDSAIEVEGIKLSYKMIEQSNMIIVMNDISEGENYSLNLFDKMKEKYPDKDILYVQNKIDLKEIYNTEDDYLYISSQLGSGVEAVKNIMYSHAQRSTETIKNVLINKRHAYNLSQAVLFLNNALNEVKADSLPEIISFELRQSLVYMEELTGKRYSEDVLNKIFSGFCIGK